MPVIRKTVRSLARVGASWRTWQRITTFGFLRALTAGIKIAPHSEKQVVRGIAAAMRRLAEDSELRATMGSAGRQRVLSYFSWPAKCVEISQTYPKCLGPGAADAAGRIRATAVRHARSNSSGSRRMNTFAD